MAYYRTCSICGSNLDPGERCDCVREKEREREGMEGNGTRGEKHVQYGKRALGNLPEYP